MRRRTRGSMGQMISTVCFVGTGLYMIGEASITQDAPAKTLVLYSCGILSLAGAMRHQIAWVAHWFRPV